MKIKENFTISDENSKWLRDNFENISKKVDEILTEYRENSTNFYQKMNQNLQKIEEIEQENEIFMEKILKIKKESEIAERKKATEYLKKVEAEAREHEKKVSRFYKILKEHRFIEELKLCKSNLDFLNLSGKIMQADSYSSFIPDGTKASATILAEIKLLIEKELKNAN